MPAKRRPWYRRVAAGRRTLDVIFTYHALVERMIMMNVEIADAVEIIRSGSFVSEMCEEPDKVVFQAAHRKRKLQVVCVFREDHIRVITVIEEL